MNSSETEPGPLVAIEGKSEFRYRLDGGDWVDVVRERPAWCGESGWSKIYVVADDLSVGTPHRFILEVTHGGRPECTDTHRLALIGIIP